MNLLKDICESALNRAAAREAIVPLADVIAKARDAAPPRDFLAALADAPGTALICEIKRRSPSKGPLAPDLDPATLAARYAAGGARCLSVLCEPEYFGGNFFDLQAARNACSLPALQKDFIVTAYQIYEGRAIGADAQLLIVAALTDDELARLYEACLETRQAALIEVHTQEELERALRLAPQLIGVNNRDLSTFTVSLEVSERLLPQLPENCIGVAESGIANRADVLRLQAAGARAFLVGEALVASSDATDAVAKLLHD
jgi:indole-3-glycerol phosphate synthase